MNSILLRTLAPPARTSSLVAFTEYRSQEQNAQHSSVTATGALLEYETLELRVHPPNVEIDNESYGDRTLITLDSANRPGTLVEVVQLLTELGLCVIKARISSDGGWFVDEFHVTDCGKKVTNDRKLRAIRKVLSVDADPGSDEDRGAEGAFDEAAQSSTVFELAGTDRMGLLADVIALLKNNGCEVRSAAVWTHHHRCAFVISVLEGGGCHAGAPIKDGIKLARLRQLLLGMMDPTGDSIVNVATTKGLIHYERRLHQLLLREEEAAWRRQPGLAAAYEAEITEQQAQHEKRWTSSPAAGLGLSGSIGSGSSSLGSGSGSGSGSLGRQGAGPASRQASQVLGQAAGAGSGPGNSGALLSPGASHGPSSTPASAAAAAAEAAAANVTTATGSPTVGSPTDNGGCSRRASGAGGPSSNGGPYEGRKSQDLAPAAAGTREASIAGEAQAEGTSHGGSAQAHANGNAAASADGPNSNSSVSSMLPAAALVAPPSPFPPPAPAGSTVQKPEVLVQHTKQHNYWTVSIRCKDRQKLLFDTVCTLADLNYDVFHGAVDCEVERERGTGAPVSIAVQTFYMRPRYGDSYWDVKRAAKLRYMLECAIQRRQPQGTKVHIQGPAGASGGAGASDLPALTAVWRDFGLCISRAKVRALAGAGGTVEHTFYVLDHQGRPPADTVVQAACQQIGGLRLAQPRADGAPTGAAKSAGGRGDVRFCFTVQARPGWGTGASPTVGSVPESI